MRLSPTLALPTLLLLAGCAGGGGASVSAGDQNIVAGPLQITAKAGMKPAVVTSGTTTNLIAVSNGSFTNVLANLPKTLSNTAIVFGQNRNAWIADPTFTNVNELTTNLVQIGGVSFSINALGRVVYNRIDGGTLSQLYVINGDGSGNHRLSDGSASDQGATWTLDNGSVLFVRNGNICKYNAAGSLFNTIEATGNQDGQPVQSINGTIAFVRFNPSDGLDEIWTMKSDGTGQQALVADANNNYAQPCFSPDGTKLAYVYTPPSFAFQSVVIMDLASGGTQQVTPSSSGTFDVWPTYSPDGLHMLFGRNLNGSAGMILEASGDGSGAHVVYTGSAGSAVNRIQWSPYLANKLFVGTGGTFGTACDGFVLAQQEDTITSFVAAIASTGGVLNIAPDSQVPAVQRITPVSGTIKTVLYANGFFAAPTTVSTGVAKQVVVTFDSLGRVSLVIPVSKMSTGAVITGALAVYDSHGKNLLPAGKTEVRIGIDGKTLSIR